MLMSLFFKNSVEKFYCTFLSLKTWKVKKNFNWSENSKLQGPKQTMHKMVLVEQSSEW